MTDRWTDVGCKDGRTDIYNASLVHPYHEHAVASFVEFRPVI